MVQLTEPRRTEHLVVRAPVMSDLDDLALVYGDPSVNRYLYSHARDRLQTLAELERVTSRCSEVEHDNLLVVAIEHRESARVIGDFILKWTADHHRQGEIGGKLHPEFHGRGFATEVYRQLLEIAFIDFGLHRIVARCDGRNIASIRSLEKAGLHREAHFVENEFVKGEWTDEVVLAIRRVEWEDIRANG